MGVFTIVFPTSIISNNFAAEWEAFHKAQKVHDQRLLLYEYEYKRHDLARVWNYANQAYDMADRSDDTDRLSSAPRDHSDHSEHSDHDGHDSHDNHDDNGPHATLGQNTHLLDSGSPAEHHLSFDQTNAELPPDLQKIGSDDHLQTPVSSRMAPFEYDRIIEIGKKIEKKLGIPGVSMKDMYADGQINQNLVINAMYSKLYNEAYGTLCERLLLRLVEHTGLNSVDDIARSLKCQPSDDSLVNIWPHERSLSMLEYNLLCYVFENIGHRIDPNYNPYSAANTSADNAPHKPSQLTNMPHYQKSREDVRSLSDAVVHADSPVKAATQRIKLKLGRVYNHLPLSHEPTHQSVESFIASNIASKTRGRRVSRQRFNLQSARKNLSKNVRSRSPASSVVAIDMPSSPD
ncbi:hypothetical protein GGF37_006641 [Kickxella alabastrina]|nr:hypothetical protein GGF37_006641 [Kickxella alabastrina]